VGLPHNYFNQYLVIVKTILKRNKKRLKQNKNLLGLPMPEGD
jgi:hypothetical protein